MTFLNATLQRYFDNLIAISVPFFVVVGTLIVITVSVPLLYIMAWLFQEPYGWFLFGASVVLPALITPVVLCNVVKISNRSIHFQKELENAVEENKRKELLLYEQARFAFMGEMLSNISHQWRQPLNTINLAIFSAKTEMACQKLSDKHLNETFDLIETNSHYLSNTIDDFKSFFQKKNIHELRQLEDIMHEVQSVIAPILKYHTIKLVINNHLETPLYLASPISQVLLNLIGNSVDALKSVSGSDKQIRLTCKLSHEMLEVSCCDNGLGISDDVKPHIFDPYFTTKPKSQGTGIGLYMSRQIVEKMFKGRLVLAASEDSIWTCFKMRLQYYNEKRSDDGDIEY
jgi:signal transduction histidine kinase